MCAVTLKNSRGVGSQVRKNKIKFLPSNKISEIQHKKYLALYSSLQSDWLTRADRNEVRSKNFKMSFSISSSQLCSHTPSALNAGAKRSGATCHMAMPQCCYLAKGTKRPSHTTNMKHFFGLVQPKFIFGLLQPKFIFGLVQPKFIFGLVNSRHSRGDNQFSIAKCAEKISVATRKHVSMLTELLLCINRV